MADRGNTDRPSPERRAAASPADEAAETGRAQRQSELLDEGLMETFPASDPVSVVRII